MVLVLGTFFLLSCGNGSSSPEEKAKIIKAYEDSLAMADKAKQDSIVNSDLKEKKIINIPKNETILNFKQLYPILKKNLLEIVCESYRIEEGINSLSAYSLIIKDIDNDGLIDYTLEMTNGGGGCGGQIEQSERWTLFGSKPDRFKWTHTIPYRSESGKWEKN